MSRRVLASALGALGQRGERLMPSLTMLLRRSSSSAVLPLNRVCLFYQTQLVTEPAFKTSLE